MPQSPEPTNPPVRFVAHNLIDPKLSQREINELHRSGYLAAWRDGLTIHACPYRRDDTTGTEYDPDRARAWITGFSAAQTDLRIHREGAPASEAEGRSPY